MAAELFIPEGLFILLTGDLFLTIQKRNADGFHLIPVDAVQSTGAPARADLPGNGKRRLLLSDGFGFHSHHNGQRRRKTQRGSEIAPDFVQVNAKITAYGEKTLAEIFGGEEPAAE